MEMGNIVVRIQIKRRKGVHRKPWQVLYRDGAGRRRSKQFLTAKDAQAWSHRTGVDVMDGIHVADRASIPLRDAARLWLDGLEISGLERSTISQYRSQLRNHILPLLGAVKLAELSVPQARRFKDALRASGRSAAMSRKIMVTLGTMLADAVERGLAARNPVRDMKRIKRTTDEGRRRKLHVGIDIPSPVEARSIIHSAQGRWRPMIVTLIFTGLRSSEMRGLRWSDIDFDNRILHVRQRVDRYGQFGPPKSEAGTRSIPMPPFLVNTLREWKLACPPRRLGAQDLGLVFPNIEGRAITHADLVIYGLIPTLARAGLAQQAHDAAGKPILNRRGAPTYKGRYTGTHTLRHFYASWLINRKVDGGLELPAKIVQQRMGHSTIVITLDTYGHLFPEIDDGDALALGEKALLG